MWRGSHVSAARAALSRSCHQCDARPEYAYLPCHPIPPPAPRTTHAWTATCAPPAPCRRRRTATRNISAAGIRRSPIIAPDVRVGKGENEVGEQAGCVGLLHMQA
eukprot:365523-Chlamydomonas_euryale.AAC.5